MLDSFECMYREFGPCQGCEQEEFEKHISKIEDIRSELLLKVQILSEKSEYVIFVATSQPWLLEPDLLDCVSEKMFIGLPTWQSIAKYLKDMLAETDHTLTPVNILELGKTLEG